MKKIIKLSAIFLMSAVFLVSCTQKTQSELLQKYKGKNVIELSDDIIKFNGNKMSSNSTKAVYASNDIVFYPEGKDFTFGEGEKSDEHSQTEADRHKVIHITKPGEYVISGKISAGQIAVDLGKDAKDDISAKVTLILDNADITCTVAPAIIFYNVYECCDKDEPSENPDTKNAGANVIIADSSVNNINGSYVAKIYKSVELDQSGTKVVDSKKLHKYDATFYSKMSLNITGANIGDGVLNINAENEGLGSELHLTINGGNVNIVSGNDGINTNEDKVSVFTMNGGNLVIDVKGQTGEGDGIDSNGRIVINGGNVVSKANENSPDSGLDADKGVLINGGSVVATGSMLDSISKDSANNFVSLSFAQRINTDAVYTLKDADGNVVFEYKPDRNSAYLVISSDKLVEGTYSLYENDSLLGGIKSNSMGGFRMGGFGGMGGRPDGFGGQTPRQPAGEFKGEFKGEFNGDFGAEFKGGFRGENKEGTPPTMQRPENFNPENFNPENFEMPENFNSGNFEIPEGFENPRGFERPETDKDSAVPQNAPNQSIGTLSSEFVITKGANHFIGITHFTEN